MVIKKIVLIFLLIIILYLLLKTKSDFQVNQTSQSINLNAKKSDYNVIDLEESKIKLDTVYENNYNIDVRNSIIAEDSIKINGKVFDIDKLRYIKKLPIHFQEKICLSDKDGIECITSDHIDMINGRQPINIVTYPDNYRKCLTAKKMSIKSDWRADKFNYNIYGAENCENGNKNKEFFIQRNDEHSHSADDPHYHLHGINVPIHSYTDIDDLISTRQVISLNNSTEEDLQDSIDNIGNTPITRDYAIESGIDGAKFDAIDNDNDGQITLSQYQSLLLG